MVAIDPPTVLGTGCTHRCVRVRRTVRGDPPSATGSNTDTAHRFGAGTHAVAHVPPALTVALVAG